MTTVEKTGQMYDKFLDEYVSEDAVRKYTTGTAGYGIDYLLRHDYARIYLKIIDAHLRTSADRPLRLLEFGCGGGMNITRLVSLLQEKNVPVERAYGADFSPRLVEAAEQEARTFLPASLRQKVSFHIARNEQLLQDMAAQLDGVEALAGSFDLIVGVNTFRYCHRLGKECDCAKEIYRLLRINGVCIVIDMNSRFPGFRSRLNGSDKDSVECYLPLLEEYASPFRAAGFDIIKKENFCWIPHSAGPVLTLSCRLLSPFLNVVARSRAMRSLVVAQKRA